MSTTTTKKTSLFAVTLAAILVTGCLPEDSEDPNNPDPGPDADFYDENGWELVWSDEFDGTVIDDSKWAFEVNCWGGGNNEHQCYVDHPDNAFVDDGKLYLRAIRDEHTGAVFNPDSPDYDPNETNTQPFTSARLRSVAPMPYVDGQDPAFYFSNDWTYGRFEIRAKLPSGQGTWPAIWMLPTDWEFGGWASSGEIDIMEAVNLKAERELDDGTIVPENRVHGTLHYGREWPNNVYSGDEFEFHDLSVNPADDFHTYAIEWEEGAIRWFIDGEHFATQTQEGWYTHYQDANGDWLSSEETSAPFNKDFHLILNLAIGGNWAANVNEGGVADDLTQAEMVIDYVRVYQCEDDVTGVACASKGEEGTYALNPGTVEPDLPVVVDAGPTGELTVFEDTIDPGWLAWDSSGSTIPSVVTDSDAAYGDAVQFDVFTDAVFGFTSRSAHGATDGVPHDGSDNATLEFDLKLLSAPTDTTATWKLKLESAAGPSAAEVDLDTSVEGTSPVVDTWQHYTFELSELQEAGLDPSAIDVVMVFPEWGKGAGASYLIDNLKFVNPTETAGPLTVYSDEIDPAWNAWDCCGGSTPEVVTDPDAGYGNVVKFDVNWDTVVGFTARPEFAVGGIPHNASENTTLEFDLKMVKNADIGDVDWKLKVESNGGAEGAEVDLAKDSQEQVVPELNIWKHYTFMLSDLEGKGLDVSAIDVVLVFPAWHDGIGASFHIDNVEFK